MMICSVSTCCLLGSGDVAGGGRQLRPLPETGHRGAGGAPSGSGQGGAPALAECRRARAPHQDPAEGGGRVQHGAQATEPQEKSPGM